MEQNNRDMDMRIMPSQQMNQAAPQPSYSMDVDTRNYQEKFATAEGRFVVCRLLFGTSNLVSAAGILSDVGSSYFTLLDPCTGLESTWDIYSLKAYFVYPSGAPEVEQYCSMRQFELGLS